MPLAITRRLVRKIRSVLLGWLHDQPWRFYMALRINNLGCRRQMLPVSRDDILRRSGIAVQSIELTRKSYSEFLAAAPLASYRSLPFVHTKPLEYLTSTRLLRLHKHSVLLDAAGGSGEYCKAVDALGLCTSISCNDLQLSGTKIGHVDFVGGSVEQLPFPSESFDAISCHHSYEHFKGEADVAFMREAIRLLRPGGTLCIAPLFLADRYLEIWNRRPSPNFDAKARVLFDRFGTFAGWGPFEGFARVYTPEALKERVLQWVSEDFNVVIHEVSLDGRAAPDINWRHNHHQIHLNSPLRALTVTRNET